MRSGAWLWAIAAVAAALLSGACSGGYPLEPTRCDDWCDATQGVWEWSCGNEYDPAGCVSQCEAQRLGRKECSPYYESAVQCYRTTPGATDPVCYFGVDATGMPVQRPCASEVLMLMSCSGAYLQYGDIDVIR
jgi:hypothetical protein